MRRKGEIVLVRDSDLATWTFVRVNNLPNPPFTWTRAQDGSSITITNDHTEICDYSFTVTILDHGIEHPSPDDRRPITTPPMIRNL
jgi:hypothetical protein